MNRRSLAVVLSLLLGACGSESRTGGQPVGLSDTRFASGSSAMVASSNYDILYTANPDNGSVSRLELQGGTAAELPVGQGPTRLARANDRLFVTLRYERAIAVLQDNGSELTVVDSIPTGAEPFGIVAREDGTRLYVALGLSGRVDEIDSTTFATVRSWDVPDQPRWLALHPNDRMLYVGSAMKGTFTVIDLARDTVESVALPSVRDNRTDTVKGSTVDVSFAHRITGDLAVAPDGGDVYVPGIYIDNTTTVPAPGDEFTPPESGGYSGSPEGQRFNPVVVEVPVDEDGKPEIEIASPIDVSVDTSGMMDEGPMEGDVEGGGFFGRVSGYPSSVAVTPDGTCILATIEGGGAVVALSRLPLPLGSAAQTANGGRPFELRAHLVVVANDGPRSLAFTETQQAWVFSGFDRAVAAIGLRDVAPSDSFDELNFSTAITAGSGKVVAANMLPDAVDRGRRLFYSVRDSRMSAVGSGVSCATCHFDGRNDGLTWQLSVGPRQTPSLAGQVSLTTPVTWTDDVLTVATEAMITSQGRMGGFGLTEDEAADIAAFVDSTPLPDTAHKGEEDAEINLGAEIFARADVGCSECHSGAVLTDNLPHELFGLNAVYTPTLLGVSASGPYLHDGSIKSLHALVENPQGMGDTSLLSSVEKDALLRYLESL